MKQVLSTLLLVSLWTVKLFATNCAVLAWFIHQQKSHRNQVTGLPNEIRQLQHEIGNKRYLLEKLSVNSQTLLCDRTPLLRDDPASLCYHYNEACIAQTHRELQIAQRRLAKLTEQDSQ